MSKVFNEMFHDFLKNNFDYDNITYNDLFYYLIKNSFDILIIRDLNLNTIWINRVPYELTGHNISEVDIRNNDCYRVLFQNSDFCKNCPVLKSQKDEKPVESEITTPNGQSYMVRSYPLHNESKKIVGFIEVILNITRKKKLKNKLEIEKLKTDLFTNLSHELKTPISIMHSTLQLLDKKLNKTDSENRKSFARHFEVLRQNNMRLYKMITNLMDINKIDKGYYKHHPCNCNIVNIIKNTVLSCKDYALKQDKELIFKTDIPGKIIACDPFDIERVILNLLSNSLKFTEPGDVITVSIEDYGNEILIIVEDTGIGIPEKCQDKIFDKFNQVDNSLTKKSEGSGLGMYIVKSLIEIHEGRITLESRPGMWTKFKINLPVRVITDDGQEICEKVEYYSIDRAKIELSDSV